MECVGGNETEQIESKFKFKLSFYYTFSSLYRGYFTISIMHFYIHVAVIRCIMRPYNVIDKATIG